MLHSFLLHNLVQYRLLGYIIVFFAMMFEGDLFLFTAFFFAGQGLFDFGDLLIIAWVGTIIGDAGWYWLGLRLSRTPGKIYRWMEKIVRRFDVHIRERQFRTILISKFVYGIHHATLMRLGSLRAPFKIFLRDDLIASLIWIVAIGSLGYFSSFSFVLIRHYVLFAEFGLLFAFLFFFLLSHLISYFSRRGL